jgi:lysophospholipase L1-like esterase
MSKHTNTNFKALYRAIHRRGRGLFAITFAGVICLWGTPSVARAKDGLLKGDLVAICGDSITEQKIYSLYIEDYLLMCQPQPDLHAMQFGWGGETAGGFLARQKNDCLVFKPTVATTCYGMNDGGYGATDAKRLDLYKTATTATVKGFKDAGVRLIVVGAPGVVDSDTYKRNDPAIYNKTLGDFAEAAKQVAAEQGVAFADVHGIMMDVMAKAKAKYGNDYAFVGGDGVHPGANGHLVMAYAFLKALGCEGNIGTITVDLKGNRAEATDGHKILSVANGRVEVESTRYPFCFQGDPAQPTTRSIIEFLPFNEELNRYTLVVKNSTADKLRVTWGKAVKVFPAADLKKGINLAAEFLDNPFSEPFISTEAQIREKQVFETLGIKQLLHSLMFWRNFLPEESPAYSHMEQAVLDKEKNLRQSVSSVIAPVKHTITIEPEA